MAQGQWHHGLAVRRDVHRAVGQRGQERVRGPDLQQGVAHRQVLFPGSSHL
jgi:hypothetical protein